MDNITIKFSMAARVGLFTGAVVLAACAVLLIGCTVAHSLVQPSIGVAWVFGAAWTLQAVVIAGVAWVVGRDAIRGGF